MRDIAVISLRHRLSSGSGFIMRGDDEEDDEQREIHIKAG